MRKTPRSFDFYIFQEKNPNSLNVLEATLPKRDQAASNKCGPCFIVEAWEQVTKIKIYQYGVDVDEKNSVSGDFRSFIEEKT